MNTRTGKSRKDSIEVDSSIISALLSLMAEKQYADITIADIVERAGIVRITFYRHFKNKREIITRLLDQDFNNFDFKVDKNSEYSSDKNYAYIIKVFKLFKKNKDQLRILQRSNLNFFILDYMNNSRLRYAVRDANKYDAAALLGALFNILMSWLDSNCSDDIYNTAFSFFKLCTTV